MEDNKNRQFHEIFKQRERYIRFAYFYVSDQQVAEDLVMDSFLYFWENRDKVDINGNLQAYILTVLKHKCLDHLKLQKLHNEAHEKIRKDALWDLDMNITTLERFEPYKVLTVGYAKVVRDAILALPDKTREVFVMSRVREMRNSEIAAQLNVSEKTVEYHMTKAMKTLRERLKELYVLTFFMI